jgi:hypothetical protein
LGGVVRVALLWLAPYPLVKGAALLYAGLLLRVRRTEIVSYATLANLAVSIVAVFLLLGLPWVHAQPIRLPVVVTYAGLGVELALLLAGVARHMPQEDRQTTQPKGAAVSRLTYGAIVRFFWPLVLIMLIQELSRPLINLFVARGPDPTTALAVLALLYTLGRIPYGWLNEIRNLASAFRDEPDSRIRIRRFAVACGLVSLAMMVVLFWTPLRTVILERWIGAPPELAAQARLPLYLFAGFSFAVTVRAYYHGIALVERRTQSLAPSAPARLAAIIGALVLLPWAGITGATLGVAALLSGFTVEAVVVWWGVRGRLWLLGSGKSPASVTSAPVARQ